MRIEPLAERERIDPGGAALLVLCSAIVGVNQVLIKIVNSGMAPVFQAGLRSACAIGPLLLYAWIRKRRLGTGDGSLPAGLLAGVLFSFEFMVLFQALEYIDVGRASVLFYSMPLWAAVGAHFLVPGDRLDRYRVLGLVLCVAGVAVALVDNRWDLDRRSLIGDGFALMASVAWASIILLTRTTRFGRAGPEMQLLYQLGVSALVLVPVSFAFGPVIRELNALVVTLFAVQVLVVVCFSFLLWFWLLSVYPASRMASFSFLAPVFGVLFGALILDEVITTSLILALVLVSAGVYLVNRRQRAVPANP